MIIKLDKKIDHEKCVLFLQNNYMKNVKLNNSEITFKGKGILHLIIHGRLHPFASINKGRVDFSKNDQTVFILDLLYFKILTIVTFLFFALGFIMIYDNSLGELPKYAFLFIVTFSCVLSLWTRKRKIIKEIHKLL